MRALAVAGLVVLAACKASPQPAPKPLASVVAAAAPPPSTVPSVAPDQDELEPGQHASSVAVFKNDQLSACIDSIWASPLIEQIAIKAGKPVKEVIDDDVAGFVSGIDTLLGDILNESAGKEATALLRRSGKAQPLRQICDKQFPGRTIVSSCVLGAGTKIRVGLEIRSFDAIPGNDRFMRGCLAAKGDWQEMAPDSRDFRREKLQQQLRALQQQQ